MNRRATKRITEDTREEFNKLRENLSRHLEADADVDQERWRLVDHAPTLVVAKTQLLLDTLLNYLMEDAIAALAGAPTAVKNEFYDLDLQSRIKESFSLEPESLEFSFDPRVIAGGVATGVTASVGVLMTALLLSGLIPRLVGGAATLVASAAAFRIAHTATASTALQRLRNEVNDYVTQSEQQVSSWLENVEEYFVTAFEEFQDGGKRAKEEIA